MAVNNYRDLVAWQRAMDLVMEVHQLVRKFPKEELYGLTSQVRRAAVSVVSNIAEGQGRGVGQEFAHHLRISRGSLQEMETQLLIAQRLGYIAPAEVEALMVKADEVSRVLRGLQQSLERGK